MQYILNFITSSFVRKNYWYIISSRIIICRFIYSFVSFCVKLFHESMQSSSIRRGLKIKQELLLETFYWSLHCDSYVFWTSDVIHRKHLGPVGESASVKNLSQVIYIEKYSPLLNLTEVNYKLDSTRRLSVCSHFCW